MLAARLTADGGVVYCPGGGTHHGRPDRASGFCYLNDPVLGLMTWLDQGLDNILYLDIDAHHGDGVQDAFHDDHRVFTLSVHEEARWPFTGGVADRAGGQARNLPVPAGLNDSEMLWVLHQAILPIARALRPQAIMLQCGADALEEDPLSRLALSNNAHWGVVRALMGLAPRFVVLGGGGYNPWSVGRCWAGVWATLNGIDVPERATPAAEAVLRGLRLDRAAGRAPPEHWFTTMRDAPRPGVVRAAVQRVVAAVDEVRTGEKVFSPGPSSISGSRHSPRGEASTHKRQRWGLGRKCFFLPNLPSIQCRPRRPHHIPPDLPLAALEGRQLLRRGRLRHGALLADHLDEGGGFSWLRAPPGSGAPPPRAGFSPGRRSPSTGRR